MERGEKSREKGGVGEREGEIGKDGGKHTI